MNKYAYHFLLKRHLESWGMNKDVHQLPENIVDKRLRRMLYSLSHMNDVFSLDGKNKHSLMIEKDSYKEEWLYLVRGTKSYNHKIKLNDLREVMKSFNCTNIESKILEFKLELESLQLELL